MPDEHAPVYILLGATGGIGSEVAQQLADDGARLVLAARTESDLDALAEETGGVHYRTLLPGPSLAVHLLRQSPSAP